MIKDLTKEVKVQKLPLIAVRNVVMFPSVETTLYVGRQISKKALIYAYDKAGSLVVVTSQKRAKTESPKDADLYDVGIVSRIEHILQSDGHVHAVVKGLYRVNINKINRDGFMWCEFGILENNKESGDDIQKASELLLSQLKKAFSMGRQFDLPAMMRLSTGISSSDLADQVAFSVQASIGEKQKLLEELSVTNRLKLATELLMKEMKVTELEREIESKTQEKFNVGIKKNILRERKRQIEEELGKIDKKEMGEMEELEDNVKKCKVNSDIKKKMERELGRLKDMGMMAPESSYIRTYLQTVLELPWGTWTNDSVDIKKAAKILDKDHYGLKDVKDRVLEYLSVINLKKRYKKPEGMGANILCFVGPPGVGKTSIGRSIADALGRKFVRASLGGIRDESEIRGHRRTYVGAMTGRVVRGLKDAGSMNPVFMLDEVDKIGADYRGDPAAALLEVLDPEQNKEFEDHYLDFPIDLSKVFFVLTANDMSGIPVSLADRVEIIQFSGYTVSEKINIAQKYLVDKQLKVNGLRKTEIDGLPNKDILRYIVEKYTREAGVRNLERTLAQVMRKIARELVSKNKKKTGALTNKKIRAYLGPEKFSSQLKGKKDMIGASTGLAWSSVGGSILFVEVNVMPGKGKLILTGTLGDVMKESCRAALSYVRSRAASFGIKKDFYKIDIHIHVPEGATPKDGPSAGAAITTALVSALTKKKISREIGMTGEITIRGDVLEIGGLKEKAIAGHRAGLKTILIPEENKKDLIKIPKEVKSEIEFIPVSHYDEVYRQVFS